MSFLSQIKGVFGAEAEAPKTVLGQTEFNGRFHPSFDEKSTNRNTTVVYNGAYIHTVQGLPGITDPEDIIYLHEIYGRDHAFLGAYTHSSDGSDVRDYNDVVTAYPFSSTFNADWFKQNPEYQVVEQLPVGVYADLADVGQYPLFKSNDGRCYQMTADGQLGSLSESPEINYTKDIEEKYPSPM
jgi:hypothetical protein